MKSTKTMMFVASVLLVLSGLCLLPSVAGQGRERSLEQRVSVLEAQVAELAEIVDGLEDGSCSCAVLNLRPLPQKPSNPSEGDLCVVETEYQPGEYGNYLYCYILGEWHTLIGYDLPNPDPRQ